MRSDVTSDPCPGPLTPAFPGTHVCTLGTCPARPRSIYEELGAGKHSKVYKGRKKKTIQYYAVKSVQKGQRARVQQEVSTRRHKHRSSNSCIRHQPVQAQSGLPVCLTTEASRTVPSRHFGIRPGCWDQLALTAHRPRVNAAEGHLDHAQVRAMHALDHKNVLKFYAWCVLLSLLSSEQYRPCSRTTEDDLPRKPDCRPTPLTRHGYCGVPLHRVPDLVGVVRLLGCRRPG